MRASSRYRPEFSTLQEWCITLMLMRRIAEHYEASSLPYKLHTYTLCHKGFFRVGLAQPSTILFFLCGGTSIEFDIFPTQQFCLDYSSPWTTMLPVSISCRPGLYGLIQDSLSNHKPHKPCHQNIPRGGRQPIGAGILVFVRLCKP